jgi:hypothetical protein
MADQYLRWRASQWINELLPATINFRQPQTVIISKVGYNSLHHSSLGMEDLFKLMIVEPLPRTMPI